MLMMVLRREGIARVRRNLIAAIYAPIDSRVWGQGARAIIRIEGGVVSLGQKLTVFVQRHGCFSLAPGLTAALQSD